MTALRLVTDDYTPNDRQGIRAKPLTSEQAADLEHIARHILRPGQDAVRELADALHRRDRWKTIAAIRKLLAVALTGRDLANRLERDTEWQTPS